MNVLKRISAASAALALCFFLVGCGTTQRQTGMTADGKNRIGGERLKKGEMLNIAFSDVPGTATSSMPPFEGRIREDGKITLMQNQEFEAEGKTITELEKEIRDRYVPKYFVNMTATVRVLDRFFYVEGQVRMPGRYEWRGKITLLGAVAAAGGFTEFADVTEVVVSREDNSTEKVNCKKARLKPELDVPIYPSDRIFVDRRGI
jgi:polysaccharide export outer membrane protein